MQNLTQVNMAHSSRRQSGFTILQMVITVAIIAIVSTFGILGVTKARAHMRVQNAARQFAVYVEKARADAIRRHAMPGNESSVESFGPNTNRFVVTMDFDGNGNVQSRTFTLDSGTLFSMDATKASFDWRGRIPLRVVFNIYTTDIPPIPVDVSGSGDVTIDNQVFLDNDIADFSPSPVADTDDLQPDPTPLPTATDEPTPAPPPPAEDDPNATPTPTPPGNGNGNGNPHSSPTPTPAPSPSPNPSPSPGASPSPSPVIPQCLGIVDTSRIDLSQSGESSEHTKPVTFTLSGATGTHTVIAALVGPNSLNISVSPTSISGNGSAVVSIEAKSGNGNRGQFTVHISASPSCGTTQSVIVNVGN